MPVLGIKSMYSIILFDNSTGEKIQIKFKNYEFYNVDLVAYNKVRVTFKKFNQKIKLDILKYIKSEELKLKYLKEIEKAKYLYLKGMKC